MNTGLTDEAESTISVCAHRFDGYAYAKAHSGTELLTLLNNAQLTGKFSIQPLENFAANFYLHRSFHGQGTLPTQFTPEWYDMALFYLHLYQLPTPIVLRHTSASDWDRRPKGAAERAAAEIRSLLRRHR
jgi:hypothetical protein